MTLINSVKRDEIKQIKEFIDYVNYGFPILGESEIHTFKGGMGCRYQIPSLG